MFSSVTTAELSKVLRTSVPSRPRGLVGELQRQLEAIFTEDEPPISVRPAVGRKPGSRVRIGVAGGSSLYQVDGLSLLAGLDHLRRESAFVGTQTVLRNQVFERVAASLHSDRVLSVMKQGLNHLPVSFQKKSANRKITQVQAIVKPGKKTCHVPGEPPHSCSTYAATSRTCPATCRLRGNGCYAEHSFAGAAARRLNTQAQGWEPWEVTLAEALLIEENFPKGVPQDGARGGRDLRLHTAGDVSCEIGTRRLAMAAREFRKRGGGSVWTYTHRWREVPCDAWQGISVLASIEKSTEIAEARERGYAPALVCSERPDSNRAFRLPKTPGKVLVCPHDKLGRKEKISCGECRLCLDRDLYDLGLTIAFPAHGTGTTRVKQILSHHKSLPVID